MAAKKLPATRRVKPRAVTFGVCAACDPRIDAASRERAMNIVEMTASVVAKRVTMPDGSPVNVVWTPVLIDGEKQADIVAGQFRDACVDAVVCAPDTWAFPQLTLMSLLSQMPADTPVNITCGNSGPRPGVVYAHAINGALAQSGRLVALNVGTWPDSGQKPVMTAATAEALVDWCYAALTYTGLRGRRVVVFGHDSMGMETALAHVVPTRRTFGLEITRLDMKLLSDMLAKGAYDAKELKALRAWIDSHVGERLELRDQADSERFDASLAMYLIVRDLMHDLGAVGGGFMSQLEWGSDLRGTPLPVADVMESLFNSTFDHNGNKPPIPYATEADVQGLLTMLFMTYLSGGQPPLFMDFRKVWEPWEIQALASTTSFGLPRRTANGIDVNRLLLLVAVLARRVGLRLSDQDVFVNVIGGLRVSEPAADLAVATAIASSFRNAPVAADMALVGEVGLSGELRSVSQLDRRLNEAAKLGFRRCLVPKSWRRGVTANANIEVLTARSLAEALDLALIR